MDQVSGSRLGLDFHVPCLDSKDPSENKVIQGSDRLSHETSSEVAFQGWRLSLPALKSSHCFFCFVFFCLLIAIPTHSLIIFMSTLTQDHNTRILTSKWKKLYSVNKSYSKRVLLIVSLVDD